MGNPAKTASAKRKNTARSPAELTCPFGLMPETDCLECIHAGTGVCQRPAQNTPATAKTAKKKRGPKNSTPPRPA
jgi:hypothetical protein